MLEALKLDVDAVAVTGHSLISSISFPRPAGRVETNRESGAHSAAEWDGTRILEMSHSTRN